jgi:hypothetical protein
VAQSLPSKKIYRGLGEDMKIIIKSAAPLSFVALLVMGGVSLESQANGDKGLFLSNDYGEMLAYNSGMRGKPPYNRSKMNRQRIQNEQRNQNVQSVEMSALEIDQGSAVAKPSQVTRKRVRGGHPNRAKSHRY